MIAVHFGAGNIGRGFIGKLLHQANFDLVFLDVNQSLVEKLQSNSTYKVIETGVGAKTHTVTNFTALNSNTDFDKAAEVISQATVLTTSVGPNVLKFLAPLIAQGLSLRRGQAPLLIMACENAIGATDNLKREILAIEPRAEMFAEFANTAVDRIVPPQNEDLGLDVSVEAFSEWLIDLSTIHHSKPIIPGAQFVDDLTPFIERKLFTVNTAHATLAYVGQQHGAKTIVEACAINSVFEVMRSVLDETSRVLIERHGFDKSSHSKYAEKTIERFQNPELDDPVTRVGRDPARKLSRNDRLIGPAAFLAELGEMPNGLLSAVEAALAFDDPSDAVVAVLQEKLKSLDAEIFVSEIMGIEKPHPLASELTSLVANMKLKNSP